MDVSGVHSGANPISGEFSVGATGRRIDADGSLGEPLREMTIASTLPEMLAGRPRGRQRPAVLLQRGHAVDPDRRDDRSPASRWARRGSRSPASRRCPRIEPLTRSLHEHHRTIDPDDPRRPAARHRRMVGGAARPLPRVARRARHVPAGRRRRGGTGRLRARDVPRSRRLEHDRRSASPNCSRSWSPPERRGGGLGTGCCTRSTERSGAAAPRRWSSACLATNEAAMPALSSARVSVRGSLLTLGKVPDPPPLADGHRDLVQARRSARERRRDRPRVCTRHRRPSRAR